MSNEPVHTTCSAHEFHVMKECEKINHLTTLGKEGCESLLNEQIKEIANEVTKRSAILKNHIEGLKILKNYEKNLFADEILSKNKWANKKMTYKCEQKKQRRIFQFDIFNCELGENIGFEKNKTRPVIILSKFPHISNIVLIAPITTTIIKNGIPLKYTKHSKVSGYIDLKQLRTVDKNRLTHNYIDRLLNEQEYTHLSSTLEKSVDPLQNLIKKKISEIV